MFTSEWMSYGHMCMYGMFIKRRRTENRVEHVPKIQIVLVKSVTAYMVYRYVVRML